MTLTETAKTNRVLVAAHRGSSGAAPENTIEAFRQALLAGADMIEADIQVTRDGVPVVHHDRRLGRTSHGSGIINEMTLEEVLGVDVGSWFSSEFAGLKVPLLTELFDLVAGRAYLILEIKRVPAKMQGSLIEEISRQIKSRAYEQNTIVASFDYHLLKKMKASCPELYTAAIGIPGARENASETVKSVSCEAFICDAADVDEALSRDSAENGIFVGVYGADSDEIIRRCLKNGVKAIGTNYPEKAKKIIEEWEKIDK